MINDDIYYGLYETVLNDPPKFSIITNNETWDYLAKRIIGFTVDNSWSMPILVLGCRVYRQGNIHPKLDYGHIYYLSSVNKRIVTVDLRKKANAVCRPTGKK